MQKSLSFQEWKKLLEKYHIPLVPSRLVNDESTLLAAARELGFPLALKIISPEMLHKSDKGGVILNVNSDSLLTSFRALTAKAADIPLDGILVQKMISGKEVIIGVKRDPAFGPVVMFGLGGIFVELFKDVSFRIPPMDEADALEMMQDTKAWKLLNGLRGQPPADIVALKDMLLAVAKLAEKEGLEELDLNPVMVQEKGAFVVDARALVDR